MSCNFLKSLACIFLVIASVSLAVITPQVTAFAASREELQSSSVQNKDQGYYLYPTIHDNRIIFCAEDDLWTVSADGGVARRLTAGKGRCVLPRFSPDGKLVAFVCTEEGHPEVYVMSSEGGQARRLTSQGSGRLDLSGWSADGKDILYVSNAQAPFGRENQLFAVSVDGGMPRPLSLGDATSIALNSNGAVAIGRNSSDPARWKRYHGGTAGELWVGSSLDGQFKPLISLKGNLVWPVWIGDRVFFLSDHEGIGNIYSCKSDGSDLRRHTQELEYYARFPSTDGKLLVYTAGARIHLLDPATNSVKELKVSVPSNPTQSERKFIEAKQYLQEFAPHPKGQSVLLIARGQPFSMPLWEGAVVDHGVGSKVRYQFANWLPDGERFVVVNDAPGYQQIEVHKQDQSVSPQVVTQQDIGHVVELTTAPEKDRLAFSNHKHELYLMDLTDKKLRKIDQSRASQIHDLSFSPDGRWLAYSFAPDENTKIIKIADAESGTVHEVTTPVRWDWAPTFDPEGKYLYFLSTRDFHPVEDETQFQLSFPLAERPFVVTLRKDVASPLVPQVRPFIKEKGEGKDKDKEKDKDAEATKDKEGKGSDAAEKKKIKVEIDFDGISGRVLGLPVDEGDYRQIFSAKNRVLFTKFPLRPARPDTRSWLKEDKEQGALLAYDLEEQKELTLEKEVEQVALANDFQTLMYSHKKRLRVIDALKKPEEGQPKKASEEPGRESGWLNLGRIKVMVQPSDEWLQMFREAWRLQKENFWDESMSKVDWDFIRRRYEALLPRVRTRGELSDLIWEVQGELGTSHAYEMLGDYREPNQYQRGFLGADLKYDDGTGGYRITRILRGDSWDPDCDSPLAEPGLNIKEGDTIAAVGGQKVSKTLSVDDLLIDTAGERVQLAIVPAASISSGTGKSSDPDSKPGNGRRNVAVKTLRSESRLRYRHWVEENRKHVHDLSNGQLGYVHVPDMGTLGFSEFHRGFLEEYRYPGLVVDVRYNGGGNVSSLILEKLLRKRIGYDVPRWGIPEPYPGESVAGPMVAVTNQFAGSDGDIFSHAFKQYKLGPLVGKRTWGGVIGIWPRCRLVDGTVTTQPEFSFWFSDVGWQVENYGVDPDYVVDISPQDYKAGRDPQLDKAIELAMKALTEKPVKLPQFDRRPSKELPKSLQ